MTARAALYVFVVFVFCVAVTWDVATASARHIMDDAQLEREVAVLEKVRAEAALLECQLILLRVELYWRKGGSID